MQENQQLFYRDGTSQLQRLQAALKESYVAIEERSTEDWLLFAQQYAKELNYYNLQDEKAGDWSGFLSGEVQEMLAYLEDPTTFKQQPNKKEWFSRPHFVLFLTFLELLDKYHKPALNQVLQNHLDYYYRDILQFKRKPARPDRVFLITELAKNYKKDRFLLPNNTPAFAGKDKSGKDLIYLTEEDLMINRARLAAIKSIFVDRRVDRFADYGLPQQFPEMMQLALGQVTVTEGGQTHIILKPGSELPAPNMLGVNVIPEDNVFFERALKFLNFAEDHLHISFANFRKLMRLKQNRDNDGNEWAAINADLASMDNDGNASFSNPRDFVQNFIDATSYSPITDPIYNDLQNVTNVYELYEELNFTTTGDYADYRPLEEPLSGYPDIAKVEILRTFISEKFFTDSTDPLVLNEKANIFHRMMARRIAIREEWLEMRDILSQIPVPANDANFSNIELPTFAELLLSKYGASLDFSDSYTSINTIDGYYQTLIQLEGYYALTAEELYTLLQQALNISGGDEEKVYVLLNKAHQNRRTVISRYELEGLGTDVEALFKAALGRPDIGDNYPNLPGGATTIDALISQLDSDDNTVKATATNFVEQQLLLSIKDFRFILGVDADQKANPDNQAPGWQWKRVYRLLEKAERKLRGPLPKTKPEQVHLNGLYAQEDATAARTGNEDETYSRWRTFGQADDHSPAKLGLAVRSTVLDVAAGDRTITLDIFPEETLTPSQIEALETIDKGVDNDGIPKHPFVVEVSGEKEWLPVTSFEKIKYQVVQGNVKPLRIEFKLASDFDPVSVLPPDAEGYLGPYPALRVLIDRPELILKEYSAHDLFSGFTIKKVNLKVSVENLVPAILRNDNAELKAEEAFEPFGSVPQSSSKLYFTHPELAYKQLDTLKLKLNWLGAPIWADQYRNYSGSRTNPDSFLGQLRLFDQGVVRKFKVNVGDTNEQSIKLFAGPTSGNLFVNLARELNPSAHPFPYLSLPAGTLADDLYETDRYFFLQLGSVDFGHSEFPGLATQKANQLAIDIANGTVNTTPNYYQVNPPYTPQLQDFTLTYTASAKGMGSSDTDSRGDLIHIHPFGYESLPEEEGNGFLPAYSQEGYLYLGIEDLDPPYDLSLLFQLAEGSADPDVVPPPLDWRYLVGDQWHKIDQKGRIISDGTHGLLNSGIIKLRIPAEANTQHQQLPTGLFWLRASVRTNSAGLNDTIGIHPHTLSALFADQNNDPTHLQEPLAPESIKKTARPQPEIKGLQQPYSSFRGHPEEPLKELNTRVSERLRHKNRALTLWDYERLVLEAFPQVYKVKCLPGEMLADNELGQVVLIVIPNIIGIRPFDPFEPKLPLNILQEIQAYLVERAPAQAEIIVQNPVYIQLKIRMSVEFYPDYQADAKYYLEQLHQALLEYLAPWAFDTGADIAIGGKVYPSLIVDFVERLNYVDYVKDFRLIYGEEDDFRTATNQEMQEGLIAPRADTIWVSAHTHSLTATGSSGIGVGYMIVETDFQVA